MIVARIFVSSGLLFAAASSSGFESDVHFGLTQWLALQAGFDEESAKTIAVGDQRVESGDMQYVGPVLAYACVAKDDLRSKLAGERHYPSAGTFPGAPERRTVLPGGDPAKKAALDVIKVPAGQANYMLFRLGEALHILQDSWSHQGIPGIPQPADGIFVCDRAQAWGHPAARGGWNSHKADLTMAWPADTVAMAKAVYEVLMQYPQLSQTARTSRKWDQIRPSLDGFITASTKTEKKRWFASHGISDVSFLEGISLRDGAQPFDLKWAGRKLPPLAPPQSPPHAVGGLLPLAAQGRRGCIAAGAVLRKRRGGGGWQRSEGRRGGQVPPCSLRYVGCGRGKDRWPLARDVDRVGGRSLKNKQRTRTDERDGLLRRRLPDRFPESEDADGNCLAHPAHVRDHRADDHRLRAVFRRTAARLSRVRARRSDLRDGGPVAQAPGRARSQ